MSNKSRARAKRGAKPVSLQRDDARARRSRDALLDAFGVLVLSRPYDAIRVVDVLARAKVSRSTFYEHFRDKDALLRTSIAFPFSVLAALARDPARRGDGKDAPLESVLDHFWENRLRGARLFRGPAAPHVARALRDLVEGELAGNPRAHRMSPVVRRLVATQIAWTHLGLLQTWLGEEVACPLATIATQLRTATAAMLAGPPLANGAPAPVVRARRFVERR